MRAGLDAKPGGEFQGSGLEGLACLGLEKIQQTAAGMFGAALHTDLPRAIVTPHR